MAKITKQVSQVIAVDATNVDLLEGTRFKFSPVTGLLTLAVTGGADGAELELFVGPRNSVERSNIGGKGGVPSLPDDILVDDVEVFAGETIQCLVSNPTAAAITVVARFILDDNVAFAR